MQRFSIPYLLAIGAAILVLAGGAFIVFKNIPAPASSGLQAWSGQGTALVPNGTSYSGSGGTDRTALMQQFTGGTSSDFILPNLPQGNLGEEATSTFDVSAFLRMLVGSSSADSSVQVGNTNIQDAYAFVPTGLVSTASYVPAKSATQQALYVYGNDVGSIIQSYESLHRDAPTVLRDQAEDRTDPTKAAKLTKLANDLASVGSQMLSMENVPAPAAAAHAALGQAYVTIGQKLAAVPQTTNDTDFVRAVQAYDTAVDSFVSKYAALAQLFGTYGVTFSQDDPGSVFTFNSNLQL